MSLIKKMILVLLCNITIVSLLICDILIYDNTTLYNYVRNQELINIVKTNKITELNKKLDLVEYKDEIYVVNTNKVKELKDKSDLVEYKDKIYQYVSDNSTLSDSDITKLIKYSIEVSNDYNIDPLLIISLMKYESSFNKNARSKSGAKGLLQITKIAEKEVTAYYDHIPDELIVENEMHRHIIYAISYLNILLSKYKDIPIALESYKIGPSKMDSILDNNKNFKVKSTYVTNILSTYANIKMICLSSD